MCDVKAGSGRTAPAPKWLLLYGVALLMVAGVMGIDAASSLGAVRPVLEVILAGVGFASMTLWIRSNRAALDLQSWCECASTKTVMRIVPSRRPASFRVGAAPPPGTPVREYEDVDAETLSVR